MTYTAGFHSRESLAATSGPLPRRDGGLVRITFRMFSLSTPGFALEVGLRLATKPNEHNFGFMVKSPRGWPPIFCASSLCLCQIRSSARLPRET